jgi:hypothetical protein
MFVVGAILLLLVIERIRSRRPNTISHPGHDYVGVPTVEIKGTPRISKPPEPINRNEFLQARIAYLAWMRAGIEFTTEKVEEITVDGEVRKIRTIDKFVRPATPKEMIEFVNIRDEEHVFQLLETWTQAQQKTAQ